jgi:hypothetical protein
MPLTIVLALIACSSPAPPAAAPPAAAPPAVAPLAAAPPGAAPEAPALPSATTLPVGKWYYEAKPPGIEYILDVKGTTASLEAVGVQTNIKVDGELRAASPEGWNFVVTADHGSVPPLAPGKALFRIYWIASEIVGENNEMAILETSGAIALFSRKPPASVSGCKPDAWRCDGPTIQHCEQGSWVSKQTCDAQHVCNDAGSPAVCYDKE